MVEQSHAPHLDAGFLDAFFEAASGWDGRPEHGNYALPVGGGRLVVILLMFIGRLGPISVFAALSRTEQDGRIEFPSESVLIG